MVELVRTDSENTDFRDLVIALDKERHSETARSMSFSLGMTASLDSQ